MPTKIHIAAITHSAIICALAVTAVAFAETPTSVAARTALADLEAQSPARRSQLRYLDLQGASADQRPQLVTAVNYLLNAVSRSRLIVRPALVAEGLLLRVDLADYANPREPATLAELIAAWEQLVEIDPYFHLRTQVAVTIPATPRGKANGRPTGQPAIVPQLATVTVDGGWIPVNIAARLKIASGSAGAVLRGDYFVAHASQAPHYYLFAGVPETEEGLLRRLGIDRLAVDRLSADTAANMFISQVTSKPRRLVRLPGPLGGTWFSRDIEVETPDRDPLCNPVNFVSAAGTQRLRYDASEWFAQKENKFWLTAVFDAAGRRQDSVKDTIAKDSLAHDGIVRPLVSCVRCHELGGGRAAMQPILDDQSALLSGEAAVLRSYLPEVARRVSELYDPQRLNREQERDREDYSSAVTSATGLAPREATEALARIYGQFVDRPVTLALAASECGLTEEQCAALLQRSNDPVLLALRSGRSVRRTTYEASVPELMLLAGEVSAAAPNAQLAE